MSFEDLHLKAMEFADSAFIEKRKGSLEKSGDFYSLAYEYESKAAMELKYNFDNEPIRSILFRSAASLANLCGKKEEAEKLIAWGLIGNPPASVKNELQDLYEEVTSERHFIEKGFELSNEELQFTMVTSDNMPGFAPLKEFKDRIEKINNIITRSIEYDHKQPFRASGPVNKDIDSNYEIAIYIPRAASFAVSFKVIRKKNELFPDYNLDGLINKLQDSFELYKQKDEKGLRTIIDNDDYFNNFKYNMMKIEPNGKTIRKVGFTTKSKSVIFDEIKSFVPENSTGIEYSLTIVEEKFRSFTGILSVADDSGKHGKIYTTDHNGKKSPTVYVPKNLMQDIVRPYFGSNVILFCEVSKGKFIFQSIDNASSQLLEG
jgi:hypothetical protein